MAIYMIKRKNKNKRLAKKIKNEIGYEFKPNIHNKELIQISNLFILDEKLVHNILLKKTENAFRRLASITLSVVEDEDATSADAIIALDEIAKQKSILLNKYQLYLKKEEQEKMLKRLKMLEIKLKERLLSLENIEEENFTR